MITHQPFQGIIARDSLHIAWIKQRSVVDSIKEKCDLISHLSILKRCMIVRAKGS